jgi:hypothetical protein
MLSRADLEPPEHIHLRFIISDIAFLILGHAGVMSRDLLRRERLKFHDVRARCSSGVDQRQRKIQAAVVIDARLGDHCNVRSRH